MTSRSDERTIEQVSCRPGLGVAFYKKQRDNVLKENSSLRFRIKTLETKLDNINELLSHAKEICKS